MKKITTIILLSIVLENNAFSQGDGLKQNRQDVFNSMSSRILNSSDHKGKENYFDNKSTHWGFNFGLISPTTPIVMQEVATSSLSTAATNNYLVKSPGNLGVTGGVTFDPIITDRLSFGFTGSGCYGVPISAIVSGGALSDGSGSTTTYGGVFLGYSIGVNATYGRKKVKLYLGYSMNYFNAYYNSDYTLSVTDYYGNTTNNETKDAGNSEYHSHKLEMGVRLGDYKKTVYDILYGIESSSGNSNSYVKFVVWCPSTLKAFVEYGNYQPFSGTENLTEMSSSLYLTVGIVYCKDWFKHKKDKYKSSDHFSPIGHR